MGKRRSTGKTKERRIRVFAEMHDDISPRRIAEILALAALEDAARQQHELRAAHEEKK